MAIEEKSSEMSNFSIQDTSAMSTGSTELLNDLMSPETGTGTTEDLVPIDTTTEDTTTVETTTVETTTDTTTNKPDENKPNTDIQDFLATGDETTTDETTTDTTTTETTAAEGEAGDGDGEGDEGGTPFESLSKELTELGVFSAQEEGAEPITTPEQFLEKFQSEKQSGAVEMVNNFIGQFGEDYQTAFDAIFVKGADPKEYFNSFNKIQDFTNLDLTVEDNQKAVLRQALTNQGFEAEDVTAEIERVTNYGDLEDTAKRHHKVLVKNEAQSLQEMSDKAAAELSNKTAIKNEYVNNVQTILQDKLKEKGFDGIPLNPKLANELHDFLLVDKYKTPSGETLTDFDRTILDLKKPENHSKKVKLGLLLKILEKDPTLSTIQKTGITKKTNKMFSEVARQVKKPLPTNRKVEPAKWFK